jgi:hypothetical protein
MLVCMSACLSACLSAYLVKSYLFNLYFFTFFSAHVANKLHHYRSRLNYELRKTAPRNSILKMFIIAVNLHFLSVYTFSVH